MDNGIVILVAAGRVFKQNSIFPKITSLQSSLGLRESIRDAEEEERL
jgi:hypothetical protein